MAKIGELFVLLGLDIKDYKKKLDDAEKASREFSREVEADFVRASRSAVKFGDVAANSLQQLKGKLLSGLAAIGAALTTAFGVKTLFDFNAEMESAAIAFETLLGSAAKANKFIQDLADFAAKTPFEFQDVQEATKKFMALGFSAREVIPTLTAVGDAAAAMGGGKEMIDGIVMALGQMRTKGRVQAEELLQLAERGVPVYQILQEELGLTAEQVANIGNEAIPANKAIQAIVTGIEKRYAGMMNKMSDTTTGMISTIKDSLKIIGGNVFAGAFEGFKNQLRVVRDYLNDVIDTIRQGGIKAAFEKFVPKDMQKPILLILGAIKALWQNLKLLYENIKPLLAVVIKIAVVAASIVLPIINLLVNTIANFTGLIKTVVIGALRLLGRDTKAAEGWFSGLYDSIAKFFNINIQLPEPEAKPMEDYAGAVQDTADATKDAQKETKKFLAAFDEVYQVAEDTDDAMSDLAGLMPGLAGKGGPPVPPGGGLPEAPGAGGGIPLPQLPTVIPPIKFEGFTPPPTAVVTEFETAGERIVSVFEAVKNNLQPVWEAIRTGWQWAFQFALQPIPVPEPQPTALPLWQATLNGIAAAWQTATSLVQVAWNGLVTTWQTSGVVVAGIVQGIISIWQNAWQTVLDRIALIQTAWNNLTAGWQSSVATIQGIAQGMANAWQAALDRIRQAVESFGQWAGEAWRRIGDAILKPVQDAFEGVRQLFDGLKDKVSAGLETALTWIKQMWENHKTAVLATVGLTIAGIVLAFTGLPGLLAGAAARLLPAIIPAFTALVTRAGQIFPQIASFFSQALNRLPNLAQSAINGIVSWFTRLPSMIWNAIKSIPSMVSNALRIPGLSVPKPAFAVPGAQAGGIFMKPAIIGIAEKEPEAAIPLSKLNEFTRSGGDVHLHVGVLVADERGLKELERRLRSIRLSETSRTGAML